MRLSLKTRLIIAVVLEIIGVAIISLIFNRIIETIVALILFIYFRRNYTKTFHAESIWKCLLSTLVSVYCVNKLSLSFSFSIGAIVIISYIMAEVMYKLQDYIDLNKVKKFKIYKGMNKQILIEKCKMFDLTDIEIKVLTMYYCDKLKRWQIGNVLNYSEDNISKIKEKALNKFKESSES